MAITDSDSVLGVMSDSGDPSTTQPRVPKKIKLATAKALFPAEAKMAGSESDPNADPNTDPSTVVARNNSPSTGGSNTEAGSWTKSDLEQMPYTQKLLQNGPASMPNLPDLVQPTSAKTPNQLAAKNVPAFSAGEGNGGSSTGEIEHGAKNGGAPVSVQNDPGAASRTGASTQPKSSAGYSATGRPTTSVRQLSGSVPIKTISDANPARIQPQPQDVGTAVMYQDMDKGAPFSVGADQNTDNSGTIKDIVAGAINDANTKPQLATVGPKNRFLNFLARMTGMVGDTPQPGQLYTGRSKANAIMRLIGAGGNALAVSSGSPDQRAEAEKRIEFEKELPLQERKMELEQKALENERQFREAMIGEKYAGLSNTKDIATMKNETSLERAQAMARAKGQVIESDGQGGMRVRSMTPDEVLADPVLSKNQALAQASVEAKQYGAALAAAHTDALMNPNNPTFRQKEWEIKSRLAVAMQGVQFHLAELARGEYNDVLNQGSNSLGQQLGVDVNPAPGMTIDPNTGQAVPYKTASRVSPTTGQRDQAGQAEAVIQSAASLKQYIRQHAGLFGPVLGRVNNMQEMIGNLPPEASSAITQLLSFDALAPYLHKFRGTNALEEFEDAVGGMPRNPEALIAGIDGVVKGAANELKAIGTPHVTGPSAPKTKSGVPSKIKAAASPTPARRYNVKTGDLESVPQEQ